MIYDYIVESADMFLTEEVLEEDRMVKYHGELAPKFGWCVIYVGGPGSGKGSSTKFKSRLEGDYFNIDNLKEIERMWDIKDPNTGRARRDDFETPSEMVPKYKDGEPVLDKQGNQVYYDKYRNMGNSEFVSELHYSMKPLAKKWEKSILYNPENENDARKDRLPNIILDVTGDELEKIMRYVEPLKAKGYKIAIIWILSTIEKAHENNTLRDRTVDVDNVFIPKHEDVIKAQEALFETGYIHNIDEFWVIDSAIEINPRKNPKEYHDAQNVYHIPCDEEGLKYFENIANRIDYNKKELDRFKQKRARNNM